MKKATVVFVAVPVSILDEIENAIRRESVRISDYAETMLSIGDINGYNVNKDIQQKLDRVLWGVVKKNNKHNRRVGKVV